MGNRRSPARLWMYAQGLSPGLARRLPALRGNASLYPGLRSLHRRPDHGAACPPPPAQIRQGQIRAGTNGQGRPGPVYRQIPARLFPQAHAHLWRCGGSADVRQRDPALVPVHP